MSRSCPESETLFKSNKSFWDKKMNIETKLHEEYVIFVASSSR